MATTMVNERVRGAAVRLHQELQLKQAEMNAHTVLFKRVAEEMEGENDAESVAKLREGLIGVIESSHRLDMQRSALQNVSQRYEAIAELTDFQQLLAKSTQELLDASPLQPATHVWCQQFDRAVWNVHHAGEPVPGQEQEEFVMITSESEIKNPICPLSGKPVIALEDPVRSVECRHIYERETVLQYIRGRAARGYCKCAIPGCPKFLTVSNLVCDAALKLEIEELRLREAVTQAVDYTEVDL